MRHLLATAVVLALLSTTGGAVAAQEASPDPEASLTPEQLAEAEERLATATCLGKPATIVAIPGVDTVGTQGADVIVGTEDDDVIRGEGGNDRICGGPGADTVEGGAGKDRIDGGVGDDTLDGGAANDIINGGKGDDMVLGAAGKDRLNGAGGDDTLSGGRGDDVCQGGKGSDWLPGCNDKRGTKGTLTIRKNTTLKGPHRGFIVIDANKVTLDCGGHTVRGPGGSVGIQLPEGTSGVTIRNCAVTRFQEGIALNASGRGIRLNRNRVYGNSVGGIRVTGAIDSKLTGNTVEDNGRPGGDGLWGFTFGFWVEQGRDNVLKRNHASGNGDINFFLETSRATYSNNRSTGADRGVVVAGKRHKIDANTVTGARTFGFGDWHSFANNSVFSDNVVTDTRGGVAFRMGGFKNTITGNVVNDNGGVGIEDTSIPGANSYQDNTCINNREGGSEPEGLCDDTVPAEPNPVTEPSDNADAEGEPTAEE